MPFSRRNAYAETCWQSYHADCNKRLILVRLSTIIVMLVRPGRLFNELSNFVRFIPFVRGCEFHSIQ